MVKKNRPTSTDVANPDQWEVLELLKNDLN